MAARMEGEVRLTTKAAAIEVADICASLTVDYALVAAIHPLELAPGGCSHQGLGSPGQSVRSPSPIRSSFCVTTLWER